MQGRVKFFSKEKGYGFIVSEQNNDYFYHVSEVKDFRLVEFGDIVEFTPTEGKKGEIATQITIVEKYSHAPKQVHVHHSYERPQMSEEMKNFILRMSR